MRQRRRSVVEMFAVLIHTEDSEGIAFEILRTCHILAWTVYWVALVVGYAKHLFTHDGDRFPAKTSAHLQILVWAVGG